MANLEDASAVKPSAGEHHHEHKTGFLQTVKDKLHIGHKHKAEEQPKGASVAADRTPSVGEVEHHGQPTTDLSKLAGHESEHHGGVPTFLAALPDQDIPDEVTKETATAGGSDQTPTDTKHFDSEEVFSHAQEGEHHHGVPTFLVALPDQDIPDEVSKGTATAVGSDQPGAEHFDSEEVFSHAQEGEHHHGVPTFLVALPDQDIPDEVSEPAAADAASSGKAPATPAASAVEEKSLLK